MAKQSMFDDGPRIGNYTIHDGTSNPFCSCKTKCQIPPVRGGDSHIRMPHPGYKWDVGARCPTMKKLFPKANQSEKITILKMFCGRGESGFGVVRHINNKPNLQDFVNSLEACGLHHVFTDRVVKPQKQLLESPKEKFRKTFEDGETLVSTREIQTLETQSVVSPLINKVKLEENGTSEGFESLVEILMADILVIDNSVEKTYVAYNTKTHKFETFLELPKCKLFSFEYFKKAQEVSGSKKTFNKREIFFGFDD